MMHFKPYIPPSTEHVNPEKSEIHIGTEEEGFLTSADHFVPQKIFLRAKLDLKMGSSNEFLVLEGSQMNIQRIQSSAQKAEIIFENYARYLIGGRKYQFSELSPYTLKISPIIYRHAFRAFIQKAGNTKPGDPEEILDPEELERLQTEKIERIIKEEKERIKKEEEEMLIIEEQNRLAGITEPIEETKITKGTCWVSCLGGAPETTPFACKQLYIPHGRLLEKWSDTRKGLSGWGETRESLDKSLKSYECEGGFPKFESIGEIISIGAIKAEVFFEDKIITYTSSDHSLKGGNLFDIEFEFESVSAKPKQAKKEDTEKKEGESEGTEKKEGENEGTEKKEGESEGTEKKEGINKKQDDQADNQEANEQKEDKKKSKPKKSGALKSKPKKPKKTEL
jgi:hypothetical protein